MAEPNDFVVEVRATSPLLETPADPAPLSAGESVAASAAAETDPVPQVLDEALVEDEDADEAPKKTSNLDKRFRRLTGRLRDREVEIARLQTQVETLLRTPAPAAAREPAEQAPGAPLRPEQFANYEAYIDALVGQRALEVVTAQLQQQASAQQQQQQAAAAQAAAQAYSARLAAAQARHADYDDVLDEATYPVSQQLLEELRTSEEGPELAYYLAQHPDEGQRLSQLPPRQLARELGRLEAQLGPPPGARAAPSGSRATPAVFVRQRPLAPVSGTNAVSAFDPATASLEEYRAWREKGGGR